MEEKISAEVLLAVLKEYAYTLCDRTDFNVGVSFGEKEMAEDPDYSDYNQRMFLEISSVNSTWGSKTNMQLNLQIPFHVTNEKSVQQGKVDACIINIWGTKESFANRLFKVAGVDESHPCVHEIEEDETLLYFNYGVEDEATEVFQYLQETYLADALLKLVFTTHQ